MNTCIIWLKGWPVTFIGITLFSVGCAIEAGLHAGFISSGICMMIAGTAQYAVDR